MKIKFLRESYITSLLISATAIFSCNKGNHHSIFGNAGSDKALQYKPGLHIAPGAKYYYTITSDISTDFKTNGKSIDNANNSTAGLIYELVKDSAGMYVLKMTYDRFHLIQKTGDTKTELDADNTAGFINPVERLLSLLKGGSIYITVTHSGTIKAITGYKELADTIINAVDAPEGPEKENMRKELGDMLGENFVRGNLQQTLGLLPDSALKIGDIWQKEQSESSINMNINSSYTLSSVDDGVADIDADADIDNNNGSQVNMMGYPVNVQLHGKQEGSYNLDMKTGLLIKGKSDINLKGNMGIMGTEVPVRIRIKREITLKKLN